MKRPALALATIVLVLSGCSHPPAMGGAGNDGLTVVASTNVYGSLAAQTGGEKRRVEEAAVGVGIPVDVFSELSPEGWSYSERMGDAIRSLAEALRS